MLKKIFEAFAAIFHIISLPGNENYTYFAPVTIFYVS